MTQVELIKEASTGGLLDLVFHFGNSFRGGAPWSSQVCGAAPGVGISEVVPVTAALAGFDCHYSKELNTFTEISLYMNECPIHQNLQLESIVQISPRIPVFLKMIDASFTSTVFSGAFTYNL